MRIIFWLSLWTATSLAADDIIPFSSLVWRAACWCHSFCSRGHRRYRGSDRSRLSATKGWKWLRSWHTLGLLLKKKKSEKSETDVTKSSKNYWNSYSSETRSFRLVPYSLSLCHHLCSQKVFTEKRITVISKRERLWSFSTPRFYPKSLLLCTCVGTILGGFAAWTRPRRGATAASWHRRGCTMMVVDTSHRIGRVTVDESWTEIIVWVVVWVVVGIICMQRLHALGLGFDYIFGGLFSSTWCWRVIQALIICL